MLQRYTIAPGWKMWPFKENRPSTCGCWSVAQALCIKCAFCRHGSCSCWGNMQQLTRLALVERCDCGAGLLVWEPVRHVSHQIFNTEGLSVYLWLRPSRLDNLDM